jgi:signal transduction histidine kinase
MSDEMAIANIKSPVEGVLADPQKSNDTGQPVRCVWESNPEAGYRLLEDLRTRLLRESLRASFRIEGLVEICLSELPRLVNCEFFAVYMFDRFGRMKRVFSLRANPGPVPDLEIFPAGFLVELTAPPEGASYGRPSIAAPHQIDPSDPLRLPFEAAVGKLGRLIRLPLNGSSQTFGILEAACVWQMCDAGRADPDTGIFNCLALVAATLASAITTWRARNESLVLTDVVQTLAGAEMLADAGIEHIQNAFGGALSALLNRLSEYRAAVLRIAVNAGSVDIFAKAKDSTLSWEGWKDLELRDGQYLAGKVFASGELRTVPRIEDEPGLFANYEWVCKSDLRSCACFPLTIQGRTVGTLTIYTGFYYTFSQLDNSLLVTLADVFALYWDRRHEQQQRSDTEQEISQLRGELEEQRVRGAREAAILPYVTLLHQVKNSWVDALRLVHTRGNSALPLVTAIGERVQQMLSGGEIMDTRSAETIDIQPAVAEIVRAKQVFLGRSIKFRLEVVPPVPLIKMPRSLFNEIILNLLSNAERAIWKAKRSKGQIDITIRCEKAKNHEELVIIITDNGVGIPRDKLDVIFDRGFTTFSDSGGTGLGLFLTLDIVQEYRGTIRADSKLGEGAAFTVRLPISWVAA